MILGIHLGEALLGPRGVLYLSYERMPCSFPNFATISVVYYINISGGYK
jgi:hypothetical protein